MLKIKYSTTVSSSLSPVDSDAKQECARIFELEASTEAITSIGNVFTTLFKFVVVLYAPKMGMSRALAAEKLASGGKDE